MNIFPFWHLPASATQIDCVSELFPTSLREICDTDLPLFKVVQCHGFTAIDRVDLLMVHTIAIKFALPVHIPIKFTEISQIFVTFEGAETT